MFTSAWIQLRTLSILLVLLALLAMHIPPAHAAGVIFSCTQANIQTAVNGGGESRFECNPATQTIPFDSYVIVPAGVAATLDGGGTITLDGQYTTRLFAIAGGASLTLKNITLTQAFAADDGGAIYNEGNLTLDHVTVTNSSTDDNHSGGAIVTYGPLTVRDSVFSYNHGGSGGAIYPRFEAAVVDIRNSTFSHNAAASPTTGWGGAILVWGSPVTLTGSKLLQNSAVNGGAVYATVNSTVSLQGNSLVQNNTAQYGGGVYNIGVMTLDAATVEGNSRGGVYNYGEMDGGYQATMTIQGGSRIAGNQAKNISGGGIANLGILTIDATVVISNTAGNGGGIANFFGGDLSLTRVIVAANTADAGGGLWNSTAGSTLEAIDVTIRGNTSIFHGGGIYNDTDLTLERATISENAAQNGAGIYSLSGNAGWTNVTVSGNKAGGNGGGLYHGPNAFAQITNATFSGNSALKGGAIYIESNAPSLRNTILAGSLNSSNCTGPVNSLGGNLSSDMSCALAAAFDQQGADPRLGPLAGNGGLTFTHLPAAGSPAIDAARGTTCPLEDQRGVARPQGLFCDAGSVEVAPKEIQWRLYLSLILTGAHTGQ
jgi:predicted outer membrane repeat protein